mmetsp:Transcript_29621/g.28351  ORF Transcript_29621/g.28351 Transcript_29621/m.28351 type:complete len:146 (-) Transcript_29621:18-455(-)
MGVQSSSLVPVTSVREVKKEIDGFTVKISVNGKDINDGQDLDYIQQAYLQGKEEGTKQINASLDMCAHQAYSNIKEQLVGIQNKHFLNSEEMAASIKNKTIISKLSYKCEDEKSKLLACLKNEKNEKNETFRSLVRNYENCSLTV